MFNIPDRPCDAEKYGVQFWFPEMIYAFEFDIYDKRVFKLNIINSIMNANNLPKLESRSASDAAWDPCNDWVGELYLNWTVEQMLLGE